MPSKPTTVRVRIPVAVAPNGEWNAAGWSGDEREDGLESVLEGMPHQFKDHQIRVSYIEADVPLPEDNTIEGKVSDAE